MARKRINMKKIREIIRFKETTNMSERKIARREVGDVHWIIGLLVP